MQTPTPPHSAYVSPKRKRASQDFTSTAAPSPTKLKTTNLPSHSLVEDDIVAHASPRTVVTGHFQNLDLEERKQNKIPKLDFGKPLHNKMDQPEHSLHDAKFEPNLFLPNRNRVAPSTPPPSAHGQPPSAVPAFDQPAPSKPSIEIPETPQIHSTSSPTPSPSASKLRSPPPSPALWWTDTEITGHDPDPADPADDGYGINGIGFIPTPAMASARADRRRRQVKEWKEREGREARARRGERRRRRDPGGLEGLGSGGEGVGMKNSEGRKVRFLEA